MQQFKQPTEPPFSIPVMQPLSQTPKKSRHNLWILLSIGAILLLALVAILATGALFGSSQGLTVKVGQTIIINDVDATVTGIGQLTPDVPIYGNAYIAVHVKIVNHSGSEQSYNSLDFHLKSGSGSITNETIAPPDAFQPGPLMGNGTLVPGGSVEGDIVFQVISDDHKAEVTWQPIGYSSDSNTGWILGL